MPDTIPTPLSPALTEAQRLIEQAEEKVFQRTQASLGEAAVLLDRAADSLKPSVARGEAAGLHLLGTVYLRKANLVRDFGGEGGLQVAMALYEEARKALEPLLPLDIPAVRDDLGGAWANRGIALLGVPDVRALKDALACFDQALAIRKPLASSAQPWFLYNLAGTWINRGDALLRIGGPESRTQALEAYDCAISLVEPVATTGPSIIRRREMVALINRGRILLDQGSDESMAKALDSFEKVLSLGREPGRESPNDLAALWANAASLKARVEINRGLHAQAEHTLREALGGVSGLEEKDPTAADAALGCRLLLASLLQMQVSALSPTDSRRDSLVATATDIVEEGLALAESWEKRGFERLRPVTAELFRLGVRLYETYQPHFLAEFLTDELFSESALARDASRFRLITDAESAVGRALEKLRSQGFAPVGSAGLERSVETLRSLRLIQERIVALRRAPQAGVTVRT